MMPNDTGGAEPAIESDLDPTTAVDGIVAAVNNEGTLCTMHRTQEDPDS